jgi:molybdopterin-guanine dinucleotide biosynthesis protein A
MLPRNIVGVVLAGGQSRRFGGGDKGFADLDGRPVLFHVIENFRPQVGSLILNANGDAERFAQFGLDVVSDNESPGHGPLSGILAALDWTKCHAPDCSAVATVSTDVPFLPPDLVERLHEERSDDEVAIATSAGRRHPTVAIWPLSARSAVAHSLGESAFSANALAAKLNAVAVSFPMREIAGRSVDPFFNINTPDDLATARALISKR